MGAFVDPKAGQQPCNDRDGKIIQPNSPEASQDKVMPAALQISVPIAVPDPPLKLDQFTLLVHVASDNEQLNLIPLTSVPFHHSFPINNLIRNTFGR